MIHAHPLQSVGIMHIVLSPIMKEGLERNFKGCGGAAIKSIVFVMATRDLGSIAHSLARGRRASIDYPIRIRWTAESEGRLSND